MQFYFHVLLSLTLHIFARKKRHFSKGAVTDSYKAKNRSALLKPHLNIISVGFYDGSHLEKRA